MARVSNISMDTDFSRVDCDHKMDASKYLLGASNLTLDDNQEVEFLQPSPFSSGDEAHIKESLREQLAEKEKRSRIQELLRKYGSPAILPAGSPSPGWYWHEFENDDLPEEPAEESDASLAEVLRERNDIDLINEDPPDEIVINGCRYVKVEPKKCGEAKGRKVRL